GFTHTELFREHLCGVPGSQQKKNDSGKSDKKKERQEQHERTELHKPSAFLNFEHSIRGTTECGGITRHRPDAEYKSDEQSNQRATDGKQLGERCFHHVNSLVTQHTLHQIEHKVRCFVFALRKRKGRNKGE